MNERQVKKVLAKIRQLDTEIKKLEDEATDEEKLCEAYLDYYYGERPGGRQKVEVNRNNAGVLRGKAELLGLARKGQIGVSDIARLERRIAEINNAIGMFMQEKGSLYLKIAFLKDLAQIIK